MALKQVIFKQSSLLLREFLSRQARFLGYSHLKPKLSWATVRSSKKLRTRFQASLIKHLSDAASSQVTIAPLGNRYNNQQPQQRQPNHQRSPARSITPFTSHRVSQSRSTSSRHTRAQNQLQNRPSLNTASKSCLTFTLSTICKQKKAIISQL